MSSLDKLAIRGIRSFDSNEIAVIQFFTPLTVIVGHNGSGKTTIIECLKYATTGDLPPNTKGGAFVHDPTIAGVSEVKAQVKLRFFNSSKEQMVVERRLQVTKKKTGGGLTMKTLEGVISFVDKEKTKNKRSSLSTKCAELDEEVPKQLGVSKAILENVIFCHQEESNWPLSEPAALKKKFDDIFEATKYTKALDQIKTLRKEQAVEIKVDKEKLNALKVDRDRAIKLRQNINQQEARIQAKEADHETLDGEIQKLADDNRRFYAQATKYAEIINSAKTYETQQKILADAIANMLPVMRELPGESDHELTRKIEGHVEDIAEKKRLRESLNMQVMDERDRLDKLEKKRGVGLTSQGTLLALKQRYEENLVNRQTLIQEISTRHSISGFDHDLTKEEIDEFINKLESAVNEHTRKIEEIKSEGRKVVDEKQSAIQNIKVTKAADERAKSSTSDQIKSSKAQIAEINRKLDISTTSIADISYHESILSEEKNRRTELEENIRKSNVSEQLRVKGLESRALEEKRDNLHAELTSLNTQADVRAKLGLKKTELKRKDEAIQSLVDAHSATYRKYVKREPVRAEMEAEVNALSTVVESDIKAAEKSLQDARKELNGVETSVNITKSKLKELQASAAAYKKRIDDKLKSADTDAKTIQEALSEAMSELEANRSELQAKKAFVNLYDMILKTGHKDKKCLGCDRGLGKNEMADFEKYCKQQKQRAPAAITQLESEIAGWEEQHKSLNEELHTEVAYEKLVKEDIPAAEAAVKTQSDRLPGAKTRTEEANSRKSVHESKADELQLLKKTAQDVMRMHRETEDIKRDIAKLESELSASGSTATSDDIQSQLTQIGSEIRETAASMDKIRSESQKQSNTLQSLVNSIHSAEMALNKKRQDLRDKEALEKRKEDTSSEIAQLDVKLKELEKKIRETEAPLRKLEDEMNESRRQNQMNETLAGRELQGFHKSTETLENNAKEINQYETRGSARELLRVEKDLEAQEKVIVDLKAKIHRLQGEVSQTDKALSDSDAVLRNFNDNVLLRKNRKEIQTIEDQIRELDVESAKKSHRQYESEYSTKRKWQADKTAEQSKLGGEISTMKSDLQEKKNELKSEYENIDSKYKTELIKVKTAEVANQDLEKYAKALDSAIMSFHGEKMKEINSTIEDLWNKTYQGTDIDKIMIKSEGEGKGARSYNYRVVMFKDNTEMDMRGRCSAGQKVLASIIIRLALAESFGHNCGILALDEPTTNLDQANILALASSLADLIKERRSQSNFQLLIITHDEQFLETLGGNGVLDKYWRVSRGDGGQVSTIERQRLI